MLKKAAELRQVMGDLGLVFCPSFEALARFVVNQQPMTCSQLLRRNLRLVVDNQAVPALKGERLLCARYAVVLHVAHPAVAHLSDHHGRSRRTLPILASLDAGCLEDVAANNAATIMLFDPHGLSSCCAGWGADGGRGSGIQ